MRVGLATGNPGKVREIGAILGEGIEVAPPPNDWIAPDETGETYLANARLKARSLCAHTGEPAVADDSGIEVDALGGAPGVRSARFAGEGATDRQNLDLLIEKIRAVADDKRGARYRCLAVVVLPDGTEHAAEGIVEGTLITTPRGTGGFGYDPIFIPTGYDKTMAELSPEEKDAISHRGIAFRALAGILHGLR